MNMEIDFVVSSQKDWMSKWLEGTLCRLADGRWIVSTGEGNFFLNPVLEQEINKKPHHQEGKVDAEIFHGNVMQFNFKNIVPMGI